jgi:hypothetical protein
MDELCWAEVTRLRETIARVRELHHLRTLGSHTCAQCDKDWPCPTDRTLDGEVNR